MSPNSYKAAEEKLGPLSPRPAIPPVSIHPPASWAQNSCQPLGSADDVPRPEALPQGSYSSPRGTFGSMSSLTISFSFCYSPIGLDSWDQENLLLQLPG